MKTPSDITFRPKFFTSEDLEADAGLVSDLSMACQLAVIECTRSSTKNLSIEGWREKTESLLYLLLVEKRFRSNQGEFGVLYAGNEIVALAGVYLHEEDPRVAICGSRGWVKKALRSQFLLAKHILPRQETWAREMGCEKIWITFNECNRAMALRKLKKTGPRRALLLGKRDPDYFAEFELLPEQKEIKLTPQYVWEKALPRAPGGAASLRNCL